jgi:hypothetical protein
VHLHVRGDRVFKLDMQRKLGLQHFNNDPNSSESRNKTTVRLQQVV